MKGDLDAAELHAYALEGARVQLKRICEVFPELIAEMDQYGGNNGHGGPRMAAKGGRKPMSDEQRATISKKMKRRWRARKAAEKG